MNIEDIINQIGELLGDYKFDQVNEETKMGALNIANGVLFPLRESRAIEGYQFTANTSEDSITLNVFIKENGQDDLSQWDLTINKDE